MNVTGADRMIFSNSGIIDTSADADTAKEAWGDVQSYQYASINSWTLSSDNGLKTVYSQFLDTAYNGSYYTYEITLDETNPSVADFEINNNDVKPIGYETELTYSYTEANRVWIEYRNDEGVWSEREELFSSPVTKNWTLKPLE